MSVFHKLFLGISISFAVAACSSNSGEQKATTADRLTGPLREGPWRGVLIAQGQQIPFLFVVEKDSANQPVVYLRNGEERLKLDEITTAGDSTIIRLGAFDAALVVRPAGDGQLQGAWVKYDAKEPYRVPFTAQIGIQQLFLSKTPADPADFNGTWSVTFRGEKPEDSYPAVGVFQQKGHDVTGTFLTTTGDYRYLAGQANGDTLRLSTFDGSHGFLFTATKQANSTLQGDFYSGKSGHETWTATLDPNAKLPNADSLAGMKPGQKKLTFKFPSVYEGGSISPSDPKYQGKVVVVQLLGSWCPNCMDETNFLAPWYEKNKQRGVEIIGLGYERTPDQKKAAAKLLKMKQRFNVGYDVAVAGIADKDAAAKSLPQIEKVLAFPTTIFLDKKGEVRKIHTGFSGPGTGKYYDQEIAEFNKTIDQLVAEK